MNGQRKKLFLKSIDLQESPGSPKNNNKTDDMFMQQYACAQSDIKCSVPAHTLLFPLRSLIHQSWVRDRLERPSLLIISSDSWSAGAVKNGSAVSWPPVLLIRNRTICHHRMNWLPNAWGGKLCVCARVCLCEGVCDGTSSTLFYSKPRFSRGRTCQGHSPHMQKVVLCLIKTDLKIRAALWSSVIVFH